MIFLLKHENPPLLAGFFLPISIIASTKEIVGQFGWSLICLDSLGCGKSYLRKGLTRFWSATNPLAPSAIP
jgi:hypothetical protein